MEDIRSTYLKEGDTAPDFTFEDNNGKSVKLSEYGGRKNMIVYFYPKDFTSGCSTEATEFTEDYEEFRRNNVEILGISSDDMDSHIRFRQKFHIPYMLVSDPENLVSKLYGVYGTKKFMGKEYLGITRSTFLIDKKGKITKIFYKVKPSGHSKEVRESFAVHTASND
jgi:thioredoxin-dependent peroxiredoxin